MPPVIPALVAVGTAVGSVAGVSIAGVSAGIIGAGAIGATGYMISAGISKRNLAKRQIEASESLQSQQLARQEKQDTESNQVYAQNLELQEKQLILNAQRQRIETLASMKINRDSQPQIFVNQAPQPIRRFTIVDRVNKFIEGLF